MSVVEGNPYKLVTKRARTESGEANPLVPRRLDKGFQAIPTVLDGDVARMLMAESGGPLPPISLAAHSAMYGDGLFCFENDPRAVPHVLKAFNGAEAKFERALPGQPELQLLALKQITRPIGAAAEPVRLTPDNMMPMVGAKFLGLHSAEVISCKPGVRMLWDLRAYRSSSDENTSRLSGDALADQQNAFGLVLVAYSEETVGRQFNKAASELVNNSASWERALAGHPGAARPWTAAVMADYRHCLAAFTIGLEMALKRGIVQVVGQAAPANVVGGARAPLELQSNNAGVGLPSHVVAANVANLLGLTAPTDPVVPRDAAGVAAWAEFGHDYAEALYYTANAATGSVNGAVEFGAGNNPADREAFAGRHPNGHVKDDRIGQMVQVQASHTQRAVSAFAQAVENVYKWTAGTGMSAAVGGNALLMLHK